MTTPTPPRDLSEHDRAGDLIVLCRSCHERHERNKKRRNAAQVQL